MTRPSRSATTNAWASNVISMIKMACGSNEPTRVAQILAEAQAQLAWTTRSAIEECEDLHLSWSHIAERIGMPRETVWRQFRAGGPVVTVRAAQSKSSPNLVGRAAAVDDAIYAFQTEDGHWWGAPDALDDEDHFTAMLPFRPAPEQGFNRFAGQVLRVKVGPIAKDVSFNSAQVRLADGTERRVRVSLEVINLLFEDGESPLRRALTEMVHATIGNPNVGAELEQVVLQAAKAQAQSVSAAGEHRIPATEFIAAVQAILDKARESPDQLDIYSMMAFRQLERVVSDYEAWRQAGE